MFEVRSDANWYSDALGKYSKMWRMAYTMASDRPPSFIVTAMFAEATKSR